MNTEKRIEIDAAEVIGWLGAFCSEDPYRHKLLAPFVFDGHTCATDGRALLRFCGVLGGEGLSREEAPDLSGVYGDLGREVAAYRPLDFELPPIPPAVEGTWVECRRCKGEGVVECPSCGNEEDCETCGGDGGSGEEGKTSRELMHKMDFCLPGTSFFVNPWYLHLFSRLPDLEIESRPPSEFKPMRIRWRHGDGLLMPIRDRG